MVEVGSSNTNRIYLSTNGGENWTLFMSYSGGQNILIGDSRGNLFVRGSDNQIYKAVLDGAAVKLTLTNLPNGIFKFLAGSSAKLYVAFDHLDAIEDRLFQSTDGGLTWINVTTKFPVGDYKTIHIAGKRIYVRTTTGVFFSTDEGANWNPLVGLPNSLSVVQFASNNNYIFALLGSGGVYAFPLP